MITLPAAGIAIGAGIIGGGIAHYLLPGRQVRGEALERLIEGLAEGIGEIAEKTGLTPGQVKERIHDIKKCLPRYKSRKNPNVLVDPDTGEVYPKGPDGEPGDSIGNIYD